MKKAKILSVFWHSVEHDSFSFSRTNPTMRLFKEHIRFLVKNYTPISIFDFVRLHDHKGLVRSYKKPPVLLGFDDGFKNVIRHALPILEEFKAPAVLFVIGEILSNPQFVPWYVERKHLLRKAKPRSTIYGRVRINLALQQDRAKLRRLFDASFSACKSETGRQDLLKNLADLSGVDRPKRTDLDDDLQFVDRDDLASLAPSSLVTVGSHALTHRDLATLSYEEQVEELRRSDFLLRESCAAYYPALAYPNGSFNRDTITIAKSIYKVGFAVLHGSSYGNLHAYPRIGLTHDSLQELAYIISTKRRNYVLPMKRVLHAAGVDWARALFSGNGSLNYSE